MVRRRLLFLGFLLFTSILCAKEYQIGDTADADVVSPSRLTVVDVEATEALKEKESQREPVIYRFYPRAVDDVEAAFHAAFAETQRNFLDALQRTFHTGRLESETLASLEFQRFTASFQKQNLLLPVNAELAALWAGGDSGEHVESALTSRLHDTMRLFIRDDVSPADIHVGSTLRVFSATDQEPATVRIVQERASLLNKTNFISLPRAKTDLQNSFAAEDRATGRYLASFVRANCLLEADLTRQLRAKRTDNLQVADRYEAGEVIVRRGQVVNKKILAALNQLKALAPPPPPPPPAMPVAAAPAVSVQNDSFVRWLIGALVGIFALLLIILWFVARRRPPVSLLPAPIAHPGEISPEFPSGSWQTRALQAEEQVRKAQAAARAGLISHLASWLSKKLTRRLLSQRAQLLDAHQSAAVEIAELEARLEKIRAPLQERLRVYERRVAELEKELSVKGEENRELIKAKIQLARKQLEMERLKNRLEFN